MDIDDLRPMIYEAAFIPKLWDRVLDEASRHANARGGTLFTLNNPAIIGLRSETLAPIWEDFVVNGWGTRNTPAYRALENETEHFVHDGQLITKAQMLQDEWYSVFCKKWDMGGSLGTIISLPTGGKLLFTLERTKSAGAYTSRDVARFNRIRPDIGRAAVLMADMAFKQYHTMTAMLGALGFAAVVVSGERRMVAANSLFDGAVPDLALDRAGKIHLASKTADLKLEAALARLTAAEDGPSLASIPVIAEDREKPSAIVHVIPIVGLAHDIIVGGTAMLVFSRSRPDQAPSHTLLKELFELSPAEARVASHLVANSGRHAEVATALNVSRETVRSQSKSVYQKMGLRGVEDLIALVSQVVIPPENKN